jgi:hypothetical protein
VVVEEGEDLGDLQGAIARRLLICLCVRDDGGSDVDRASGRLHPGSSSPRWSSLPSRPHSIYYSTSPAAFSQHQLLRLA